MWYQKIFRRKHQLTPTSSVSVAVYREASSFKFGSFGSSRTRGEGVFWHSDRTPPDGSDSRPLEDLVEQYTVGCIDCLYALHFRWWNYSDYTHGTLNTVVYVLTALQADNNSAPTPNRPFGTVSSTPLYREAMTNITTRTASRNIVNLIESFFSPVHFRHQRTLRDTLEFAPWKAQ